MLERGLWGYTAAVSYTSRGLEVEGYRSRGLERAVLERELSGDIAAEGYRSKGL